MTGKHVLVYVDYLVSWAGCTIPLKSRTFSTYDEADRFYEANIDKVSLRLEELATKRQFTMLKNNFSNYHKSVL